MTSIFIYIIYIHINFIFYLSIVSWKGSHAVLTVAVVLYIDIESRERDSEASNGMSQLYRELLQHQVCILINVVGKIWF